VPHRGEQVFSAHYPLAVINQKEKKIEYLWFDMLQAPSSA
jgi:hypothetical protein